MVMEKEVCEIKERLIKIEVLLSHELDALKKRVAKLEANQEWIIKLVIGAVAGAVIGLVIIFN